MDPTLPPMSARSSYQFRGDTQRICCRATSLANPLLFPRKAGLIMRSLMDLFLKTFRTAMLAGLIAIAATPTPAAPVAELLHRFGLPSGYPGYSSLTLGSDGFYWGTTKGSNADAGSIYKVKADGGGFQTVYSFREHGPAIHGAAPSAGLVDDGRGFLWGTTAEGGESDKGTVFKINVRCGDLTTVVQFTGDGATNRGSKPIAKLVSDGLGYFWGHHLRKRIKLWSDAIQNSFDHRSLDDNRNWH